MKTIPSSGWRKDSLFRKQKEKKIYSVFEKKKHTHTHTHKKQQQQNMRN